ncbi:Histone acetyltransferase KAT7 [Trichinella britovi]|uniref:Histone acetyltransferase n=1 Tax=Trichinella britovi TaxID=45882 RepID=A0A0V1D3I7_TRIBR|nr:Histone acetyltransferase KAT7 [Trichinella britovi]
MSAYQMFTCGFLLIASYQQLKLTMPKIRKNGKELANLKPLKTESYISSSRAVIGKCPYPKCTGEGHLSGKFDTHLFIEACPLKQKLTPETCVLFAKYRDLLKSSISKSEDKENIRKSTFEAGLRSLKQILRDLKDVLYLESLADTAEFLEHEPNFRQPYSRKVEKIQLYDVEFTLPKNAVCIYPNCEVSCVYVCERCFQYFFDKYAMQDHCLNVFPYEYPPGKLIYKEDSLLVYEVDGLKESVYSMNLTMFAKMFIPGKEYRSDVDIFKFYILIKNDATGWHTVGYFSKAKDFDSKHSLSCIMVMPTYGKQGYGGFLIDLSYILCKKENKIGTPERPFSIDGLMAYRRYWLRIIVDYMVQKGTKRQFDIVELSKSTAVQEIDIVTTLFAYDMLLKDTEKYWVVMSETFRKAYGKLYFGERSCRVNSACFV